MKKLFVILLCLFLMISFTACKRKNNQQDNTDTPSDEVVGDSTGDSDDNSGDNSDGNNDGNNTDDNGSDTGDDNTGGDIHEHTAANVVIENEVSPTCSDIGSFEEVIYCSECGEEMSRTVQFIKKTAHTSSDWMIESSATCTSEGLTYKECTVCHEILERQTSEKLQHKLDTIYEEDEYCLDRQVRSIYCSLCGEFVTSYGHHYIKSVIPSTCTDEGEIRYTCDICGDSYFTVLPINGHVSLGYTTVTQASCTEEGYDEKICIACKEVLDWRNIPKDAHTYTTYANGQALVYSCIYCTESYAVESQKSIFTITFSSDDILIDAISLEYGDSISYFPAITKDGFILDYWMLDDGKNTRYDGQCIYQNTDLIAVFRECQELDVSYSDISVFTSVDPYFIFNVNALSYDDVVNNLVITSRNNELVDYYVCDLGDGSFEIYSYDYQPGQIYYASADEKVSFVGTESNQITFSIKGENRVSIKAADSAKWLEYSDIYGLAENENGTLILTEQDFVINDNVIIYEDTKDNIVLAVKILAKEEIFGYNAYAFEIADYDTVFDEFEIRISGDTSDGILCINYDATEKIKSEFKRSSLYKSLKNAADKLSSSFKVEYKEAPFIVSISENEDGNIVFIISITLEFENNISVTFSFTKTLDITFDHYIAQPLNDSYLIFNKTETDSIQIFISYDLKNEAPTDLTKKISYEAMLGEYERFFQAELEIIDPNSKGKPIPDFEIATLTTVIGGIPVDFSISVGLNFEFSGSLGIGVVTVTTQSIGIDHGKGVFSKSFDTTILNIYAQGKLETSALVTLQVKPNIAGIGFYVEMGAGPYLTLYGAGSLVLSDGEIVIPKYGIYLDMGLEFKGSVGACYELWGREVLDGKITLIDAKSSFRNFPIGSETLYVGFKTHEELIKVIAADDSCMSKLSIPITDIVDLNVISQSIDDMLISYLIPSDWECTIISISGYSSRVSIENGNLVIEGVGEAIELELKIRVNDSIFKCVKVSYEPKHANECMHKLCDGYAHYTSIYSCTSKNICDICDLEFGDDPTGHVVVNGKCTNCNYITPTEGLEFYLLEDKTYAVCGISTESSTISIPEMYHGRLVTVISDYAFAYHTEIAKVYIPASVTTIGEYAFYECSNIEEVSFAEHSRLQVISNNAFDLCGEKLTSITIPKKVKSIGTGAFYGLKNLEHVIFENNSHLEVIGNYAFAECYRLQNIVFPSGLEKIGYGAFYDCTNLFSVTISGSSVYIGDHAFYGCTQLALIYNNSDMVMRAGESAYGGLTYYAIVVIDHGKITGEEDVEYILTDDDFIFTLKDGKYALILYVGGEETVTLPENINGSEYDINWLRGVINVVIPDSISSINDHAFYGCYTLKSIDFGNSVTYIGEFAFTGCSLETIAFPDSLTYISNSAFSSCKNLTSIIIPEKITVINHSTFYGCENLTKVTLHNNITEIGYRAFYNCSALTEIVLPSSITVIDDYAFYGCNNLRNVYYIGTESEWNAISIGSNNDYLTHTSRTRYYYLETEPTVAGNFWHYDENGEIVVW